jgi:uncharacterized membrane protein
VALLMCGVAYYILAQMLIAFHGKDSTLARAVGRDDKGWLSMILYAVAIPLAFERPAIAMAIYVAVAVIWFIPDRRIEKVVKNEGE